MARKPANEDEGLFSIGSDEIDKVLVGLPDTDTTIRLFRVNPQGKPAFITEFSPSDFSLEGIKNTYGGGKYKLVALSNGTSRESIFEIEGEAVQGRVNSKPVYKRYINGKLVFSKPEDADLVVQPEVRQPSGDASMLAVLLNEMRQLRSELQPRENTANVKKDFLEELMLFKNLFTQPPANPANDLSKSVVDLISKGVEIGMSADGGGNSPWMLILDKVLPTVQEALKVVSNQRIGPVVQRVMKPNEITANVQPQVVPPSEPLTGFAAIAPQLQPYLPTFVRAASSDTDPRLLVDLVYPNIPIESRSAVIAWLESETWFTDLTSLHTAVSVQSAWWNSFRVSFLETLNNPEADFENAD